MSDNDLRRILHDHTDDLAYVPSIDLDRARRTGLRNLWARRAAIPAIVAIVISVGVGVPLTLPHGTTAYSPAASSEPPVTKPIPVTQVGTRFNPADPPLPYDWMPAGYSLMRSTTVAASEQIVTGTSPTLVVEAAQVPSFKTAVQVYLFAKDGCVNPLAGMPGPTMAPGKPDPCDGAGLSIGDTKDLHVTTVDGRTAYWTSNYWGLAWQYVPGAWAMAVANQGTTNPAPAVAKTLLSGIVATMKIEQAPIDFPFEYTGAMPSVLPTENLTFTTSASGRNVGTGIHLGPKDLGQTGQPSAPFGWISGIDIQSSTTSLVRADCSAQTNSAATMRFGVRTGKNQKFVSSTTTTATVVVNGRSWTVLTVKTPEEAAGGKTGLAEDEYACSDAPINGQYLEADFGGGSLTVGQAGGITKVIEHLTVLPAGHWTTSPVK